MFQQKELFTPDKKLHHVPTGAASVPIIFCWHRYSVVDTSHFTLSFETLKHWKWTQASWNALQAALQAVQCVCVFVCVYVASTNRVVKVVEPEVQWARWPLFLPCHFSETLCMFWVITPGQWFSNVGCVSSETNRERGFFLLSRWHGGSGRQHERVKGKDKLFEQWLHQKWLIDFTYLLISVFIWPIYMGYWVCPWDPKNVFADSRLRTTALGSGCTNNAYNASPLCTRSVQFTPQKGNFYSWLWNTIKRATFWAISLYVFQAGRQASMRPLKVVPCSALYIAGHITQPPVSDK